MEAAIGAASGLIGSVVNLLSNELVGDYVASAELGLNSKEIKRDLMLTQGLLHEAQRSGMVDNNGLQGLVQELSAKADEAEDALDELHYFIIQDQLDGTKHAVPDLGNGPFGHCRHLHHTVRHTIGNCLAYFSFSRMTQDHEEGGSHVTKLTFDRVAMSKKIKSVIEEIHSLCDPVSNLLKIIPRHSSSLAVVNPKRPLIGSTTTQDTLYGRRDLFEQTIKDVITIGKNSNKTPFVLPIVGPGGIGKTTFTQHLYNDKRIQDHFDVRVWVCVSTDFDVLKLSQQILSCIERSNTSNEATNLDRLQISLAQRLKYERFLVVFDDIWKCNIHGWENLLAPFMKGEAKGSMFLVTTRFPFIADIVKTTQPITLKGLEPNEFFKFFEEFIFEEKNPKDYQHDLTDVARNIAKKLKGSPLAAKTVGRLLKKELSREHWMGVLENNEWKNQKSVDDIMPSLKISFDYLPLYLKRCFPYLSLFPEDYKFKNLEITYFWIAIGVIDKYENYMEELVDNGFLVKEIDYWEDQYYVLHDLLHELSRNVSSKECLNISNNASFRDDSIPKSIRHLSITMEDRYVGNFREEMITLRSKVDLVNLRTLMVFGGYGETIDDILGDSLKEIQGLRVLLIEVMSLEYFPTSLSKFIHLRYLKVGGYTDSEVTLPSILSRFYHLKLLDLSSWYGKVKLPNGFSRLINLRYLFARLIEDSNELHSNIPRVGKMKCLKKLRKFCAKKESVGFEMSELGELTELGGEISIHNLGMVATKEEARKAKLVSKGDLKKLELVWGVEYGEFRGLYGTIGSTDVIDGLEPHPNLRSLVIKYHDGLTGPDWLCGGIRIGMLKSLHLEGVAWVTLPPFEQLPHLTSLILRNIYEVCEIRAGLSGATEESFSQLKQIVLDQLPKLTEWVGAPSGQSFTKLEEIHCIECPNLCAVPFLLECSAGSYNHLSKLEIKSCPKLFLPPMPHTSTLTHVDVFDSPTGSMELKPLTDMSFSLTLTGYNSALAFHNIASKVESIAFKAGSRIPLAELPKLSSLRELVIREEPSFLSVALLSNLTSLTCLQLINCGNVTLDGYNPLTAAVSIKTLKVYNIGDGPRSVATDLLSELVVASMTKQLLPAAGCFHLEALRVDSISAVLVAPVCTLLAATLHELQFRSDERVDSLTEEEENALQLLTSLQILMFGNCPGLPSLPQNLRSLSSLRRLSVFQCDSIQLLPEEGIPNSLQELALETDFRSPELEKQVGELRRTNPNLEVSITTVPYASRVV